MDFHFREVHFALNEKFKTDNYSLLTEVLLELLWSTKSTNCHRAYKGLVGSEKPG